MTMTSLKESNDKEEEGGRETRRVQFEFSPALISEIERLQKELGASSRGEVIRLALGLLKVAAESEKEGGRVILEEGERKREVVLPISMHRR